MAQRIDIEPGAEHLLPFAKKKLAQLKRDTPALRSKRIYVNTGEEIFVAHGVVDLIRIREAETGIGWAQTVTNLGDAGFAFSTGILASNFQRLSTRLAGGTITIPGWAISTFNFLDCDSDLFAGAVQGSTLGIVSIRKVASGIYFTFSAPSSHAGTVAAPSTFPSQDGKVIVTRTQTVYGDGSTSLYDIHKHTPTARTDGTIDPSTVYVGTILAGGGFFLNGLTGLPIQHTIPMFDRELAYAVWWSFDKNFPTGDITADTTFHTIVGVHSMGIPSGVVSDFEETIAADTQLYTDDTGDPYENDPALAAQTYADVPPTMVHPSGDARPWWVKRLVRRVFYSRGIDNGIVNTDMVLGAHVMLWSRDVLMRGSVEAFAPDPTDLDHAHQLEPLQWAVNTAHDVAAYLYKKVPLVQDEGFPDIPDDTFWPRNGLPHPVTFLGAKVYRQDMDGATTRTLLIVEGTGVTYSAPATSATTVNIHANGQAMMVADGLGPGYILEKVSGVWVKKLVTYPIAIHGLFPVLIGSDAQPISAANGGFVQYLLALDSDVYRATLAKDDTGQWVYSEERVGPWSSTAIAGGKPAATLFRAFGAFRPYLS